MGKITNLSATQFRVTGKEASISDLTLSMLAPYIDLSGVTTEGGYTMQICLDNLGDMLLDDVLLAVVEVSKQSEAEN